MTILKYDDDDGIYTKQNNLKNNMTIILHL